MCAMQANFANLYQRQKLNLSDIIEQITLVDDKSIELSETRYLQSQELLTAIDAASIPNADDVFRITCAKSGAIIRKININEFAMLEKIHGKDHASELLQLRSTTHICAHWIATDSKSLEKLSEHDPHGYFVYAIDKVMRSAQEMFLHYASIEDSHLKAQIDYKWHLQKHQCRLLIEKQPIDKILKCNELMRRYLAIIQTSYARHIVKFDTVDILEIAESKLPNFINDLQSNLSAVLDHCWKTNKINRDVTIDDVIKLKNIFKGHSNFAGQRKVGNQPLYERIIDDLAPFFKPIAHRLHQPKVTEEQVKEMQTGKIKAITVASGTKFNLKIGARK